MKRAFTLLELMVVVALMGFMGTVTVGGYRAMRRGMEERGAVEDANQFLRAAYQRAQIDRQPVAVYYWNETLRKESSDAPPVVVGKALAVRRSGRFSKVDSTYLYDEFSDLIVDEGSDTDEEDENSPQTASGAGVYLYRLNGDETSPQRSTVKEVPAMRTISVQMPGRTDTEKLGCYAYEVEDRGGVSWKAGDAYGFEFASLQLPHGYMFGKSWSKTAGGVSEAKTVVFTVGANSGSGSQGSVQGSLPNINSLRPDKSGKLTAQDVGAVTSPEQDLND